MSINLDIRFEIHNIKDIHFSGDDTKREAIYAAAKQFLADEEILDQGMVVDFIGKEGYLCGYTTWPLIISRFDTWVPNVTKRWEEMAFKILGSTCKPLVNVEFPDEE